jgi:hypothetical protein
VKNVLGLDLLEARKHEVGIAKISLAKMEPIRMRYRWGETL